MSVNISQLLNEMESNGTVIIRKCSSIPNLVSEISTAISDGRTVAFIPGKRSLRHFFNSQGFVSAINEMITKIVGAEVVLPPGLYDGQHLVILRPKVDTVK